MMCWDLPIISANDTTAVAVSQGAKKIAKCTAVVPHTRKTKMDIGGGLRSTAYQSQKPCPVDAGEKE